MANTKIEWATRTWNVFEGCTKCSPGCENCYALRDAWRFSHNPNAAISTPFKGVVEKVNDKPQWTGRVNVVESRMDQPLKDKTPQWIFVNSRSDTFHPAVYLEDITQVWKTMIKAPWHTFIVVTKRPDRMFDFVNWFIGAVYNCDEQAYLKDASHIGLVPTCCNQEEADWNIPYVLQTPAAWRGVSIEPMLSKVNLNGYLSLNHKCFNSAGYTDALDWVICGGESGPNARPMHPDWARGLRDQCKAADTPFFFKQWGEYLEYSSSDLHESEIKNTQGQWYQHPDSNKRSWMARVGKKRAGRLLDGQEWNQFPEVKHGQS